MKEGQLLIFEPEGQIYYHKNDPGVKLTIKKTHETLYVCEQIDKPDVFTTLNGWQKPIIICKKENIHP
jgi:hypothetical protein